MLCCATLCYAMLYYFILYYIILYYYILMGTPSYMRSVVDRKIFIWRMTAYVLRPSYCVLQHMHKAVSFRSLSLKCYYGVIKGCLYTYFCNA